MENELIRRGDAIEALREDFALIDDLDIDAGMKRACINRAIYKVGLAVAVDAEEVRHGRWIDENPDEPLDPRMRCSNCTCVSEPLVKWEYCPNCGARMDGKEERNAAD